MVLQVPANPEDACGQHKVAGSTKNQIMYTLQIILKEAVRRKVIIPFMDWYLTGLRKPKKMKMIKKTGYTGGIFLIHAQVLCRAFDVALGGVAVVVAIQSTP